MAWYDWFARILSKVEEIGVWPDGLLDAYIALIPKVDGDATPLGQSPLSVLPVVYRIWAFARVVQARGVVSFLGSRLGLQCWWCRLRLSILLPWIL